MSYQNFGTKEVLPDNVNEVLENYSKGYVFTRTEVGRMERVRSLRVNLKKFETSSENRRILRKYDHSVSLSPIPFPHYSWQIHKLGKDFYDTKFGKDTFSANKIKELFTSTKNNFTNILTFTSQEKQIEGYCICAAVQTQNEKILHYAYPFYRLELINSSFGIFMMTSTIQFCAEQGFNYIYLGSVHETASFYKLQFKGLEWFDEKTDQWETDLEVLKNRVQSTSRVSLPQL